MKLLDKTPEEIVESQKARLHELECLSLQEVHYLKWSVGRLVEGGSISRKHRYAAAERLMGRTWGNAEEMELRRRLGWREYFVQLRAEQEYHVSVAKARANRLLPKGIKLYDRMLDEVKKEMAHDPMGAVRAGTPLVTGILERVMPRKEDKAPQAVIINLTAAQSAALASPELVVSAEDVIVLPATSES